MAKRDIEGAILAVLWMWGLLLSEYWSYGNRDVSSESRP